MEDFIGVCNYPVKRDFEIDRMLGYGSFGEVSLGIHRETQKKYAIKKINITEESFEALK